MEVILLERVAKLGQMGETVRVKDGYARNFLLARQQGAARHRGQQEAVRGPEGAARGAQRRRPARMPKASLPTLEGQTVTIIRQAGETGYLYGSVATRDVAEALTAAGFSTHRNQVVMTQPIKTLGLHTLPIQLHPEIEVPVTINVARSTEEAERQARGEEINVVEESSMDDLGLEVGRALEDSAGSLGDR